MLQWINAPPDAAAESRVGSRQRTVDRQVRGQGSGVRDGKSTINNQQSTIINPSHHLDLSPTLHSPLFTLHSSVGGFLFSYTMAALILGLGVVGRLDVEDLTTIGKSPRHCRGKFGDRRSRRRRWSAGSPALVDCQWADSDTEAFEHDGVPLGREYALASGFLEITYDTGAKVILQGPATYEVESNSGGFLSLGKLTARVENKGTGVRGQGSGSKGERTANLPSPRSEGEGEPTTSLAPRPSSLTPEHYPLSTIHYPLFSVRTPTAVVTDLGTEFGVEVDRQGLTTIRTSSPARWNSCAANDNLPSPSGRGAGGAGGAIRLTANQSARVENVPGGNGATVRVVRGAAKPGDFVRVGQFRAAAQGARWRLVRQCSNTGRQAARRSRRSIPPLAGL